MSDQNPYEAPLIVAELADDEHEPAARGKRPLGVWILALLNSLLGSTTFIVIAVVTYALFQTDFVPDGPPSPLFFGGIAYGLTIFGAGIGLWLGTRWGWWLAGLVQSFTILGSVVSMAVVGFYLVASIPTLSVDSFAPALMYTGRAVVNLLILAYLFRRNVRVFCQVRSLQVPTALFALFGIAIVVVGIVVLIAGTDFFLP